MSSFQRNEAGLARRNPIISKYTKRNERKRVTFAIKPEPNENVKFSNVRDKDEKNAYRERLSKLQERKIATPRLIDWDLFVDYECQEMLRSMMTMTYIYPADGDKFEDYSWERALALRKMFIESGCWSSFPLST